MSTPRFVFDEGFSPAQLGKKAHSYRRPRGVSGSLNNITVASYVLGDMEVELSMYLGSKDENRHEYVRFLESGKVVGQSHHTNFLETATSPNHLMVSLRNEARQSMVLRKYDEHVLERISLIFPFKGKVLRKKIQDEGIHLLKVLMHGYVKDHPNNYLEIKSEFFNSRLEFVIQARSELFLKDSERLALQSDLEVIEEDLMIKVSRWSLEERLKKGADENELTYLVNQKYLTAHATRLKTSYRNEEIFEITSKGLSLGVEVSTISSEERFALYAKEMGKNKVKVQDISHTSCELDKLLKLVMRMFSGTFDDPLEKLFVHHITLRDESDSLDEWVSEKFMRTLNALGDSKDFYVFAEKGIPAFKNIARHYLWFFSTEYPKEQQSLELIDKVLKECTVKANKEEV